MPWRTLACHSEFRSISPALPLDEKDSEMILYINNAEIRTLAKRLAHLTGESQTDVVKHALQRRLEQVELRQGTAPNLDELNQVDPAHEELRGVQRQSADPTTADSKWGAAADAVRGVIATSAKKTRDAAWWAAENAPRGAARVRDGAKDAALRSAVKARGGAVRVKDEAKDAAAWAAGKARDGVSRGLSATQSYGAPVITGVTAGALAVSENVRATDPYQKMLEVMRDPTPFWVAYGHLSRFAENLDWTRVDPTKYLGRRHTGRIAGFGRSPEGVGNHPRADPGGRARDHGKVLGWQGLEPHPGV